MKKTYNTLNDEQIYNLVEKIIRVSDFQLTSDNFSLMSDIFVENFFYLYDDEYTLGGMSKQESETFCDKIYSNTENILSDYFVEQN